MGQQRTLVYSFVARGTTVLADHAEVSGNFASVAAQCLQKLPSNNNRFNYNCDGHTFNYHVHDGFRHGPNGGSPIRSNAAPPRRIPKDASRSDTTASPTLRRRMALLLRQALLAVLLLRATLGGEASASRNRDDAGRFDPTRVAHVSWHPRAFLHEGFLSDAECDHLVALAKERRLEKSMVVDHESGKSVESEARTSSGVFLTKTQDEVVARIEERIAAWTFLPPENGESIQVLRYKNGEKYEPHFDYFNDKQNQLIGGQRIATVLMYLSNVKMGGETIFPISEVSHTGPADTGERRYMVRMCKIGLCS
ncbi:hypothetical protein PVAP13_9KG604501 [Panicum virgatum]|uniref:Longin domain-containing protein n=1 Tax=Panicum virgatum TaxID=38727 RepID=A0A8T0NYJ3_PANVG|nr:hypothetical protein PVAP13_9KG604501 [Panicum virgatum]